MEPSFNLERTRSAKETEGYAVFQMTLYTLQTAAEEILISHQSQLTQRSASGQSCLTLARPKSED